MRTGFNALGLAIAGFIVPFMFAYNQALLFQEAWLTYFFQALRRSLV
jgi:TRAP-type uncharacterized transport system fused permease subunit